MTVELHADRLTIDGKAAKRPANAAEWLALMRDVLGRAPTLHPEIDGIPFNGGLVGTTGYDVVRFFERLPGNARELEGLPQAVYVAPESLLVFDHLTRRVALLHAGSRANGRRCARESSRRCAAASMRPTSPERSRKRRRA